MNKSIMATDATATDASDLAEFLRTTYRNFDPGSFTPSEILPFIEAFVDRVGKRAEELEGSHYAAMMKELELLRQIAALDWRVVE